MEYALMKLSVCLAWIILFTFVDRTEAFINVDDEVQLKNRLLKNVSGIKSVRPDRITLVELSFNLLAINNVDMKNELFSVSGWWNMKWKDSRLGWASLTPYADIPVIQVYNNDIWTPALGVDNSVKDLSAIDEDTIPLRIRNDGQVTWNPPGILETSCDMDVRYFPFDMQTCSIEVTSFGYTIKEVNISVHSSLSLVYYQTNGEWVVKKTWNMRSEFNDDNHDYAKVSFFIQMERRATFYGMTTILPVLLNSLLIPLVFLLPHHSGEKIGYCLTVLLAYVVILTIVTDGLPTTARNQSLLGVYIALVLCLAGLSVFLAIHSLYLYHHSPTIPIPHWLASLTRYSLSIMHCSAKNKPATSISPGEEEEAMELRQRQVNRQNARESSAYKRQSAISSSCIKAEMKEVDPEVMSWKLVADTYDAFFLRLYFAIILISSFAFLIAMASNQF
ncbi:hypothetical protein ACOMHN_003930 [Nucella lapillus]